MGDVSVKGAWIIGLVESFLNLVLNSKGFSISFIYRYSRLRTKGPSCKTYSEVTAM